MIKDFIKHSILMLSAILLILIALSLTACHSSQPTVAIGHHFRDTTKMIVSTDTILLHDSIFTSLVSKGDTVFLTKSVTKYRYKVRQLHDTIAIIVRDSIPVYTAPVAEQSKQSSKSSVVLEAFFGVVAGVVVVAIFALLIRKVS